MSKYIVSSSPHIRQEENVQSIMRDVIIALSPALVMAVFLFGYRALIVTAVSVATCVLAEYVFCKLMKRPNPIGDLSAVVTGILLAYNLPPTVPIWMVVIGACFAIVLVKQLFGGIGQNFANPALAARVFLFSWPALMTAWTEPVLSPLKNISVDAVSAATPLSFLKAGTIPDKSLFELLLGYRAGCIGETSAILLIVGCLYLLYRKVITWHIPVSFLGTVAVLTFFFNPTGDGLQFMAYELLSGGLLLGACFMATDYSTSPVTNRGRLLFGVGCGAITVFIRYFGGYPEGVSFAILTMNMLVWFLDKYTRPRVFGAGGVKVEK